jgi:hypothetical protein
MLPEERLHFKPPRVVSRRVAARCIALESFQVELVGKVSPSLRAAQHLRMHTEIDHRKPRLLLCSVLQNHKILTMEGLL